MMLRRFLIITLALQKVICLLCFNQLKRLSFGLVDFASKTPPLLYALIIKVGYTVIIYHTFENYCLFLVGILRDFAMTF